MLDRKIFYLPTNGIFTNFTISGSWTGIIEETALSMSTSLAKARPSMTLAHIWSLPHQIEFGCN